MASKIDRLYKKLREEFSDRLDAAFRKKFRRNLVTSYNIISMRLVSVPKNGKPLTPKQKAWIEGYSEAFAEARDIATAMRRTA